MKMRILSILFCTVILASACDDDSSDPNNAPTVANPIGGLTLERGFNTTTIDLTNVFADTDGDSLTVSATSSEPSVVGVSVNGHTLAISEGSMTGSSEIAVTADDGNSNMVTDAFSVTIVVIESVDTENVFVMPIRRVRPEVAIADFTTARDAYVRVLEQSTGTLRDREMQPFGDFITFNFFTPDLDSVFVGLTSFQNFTVFQDIGTAASSTQESVNFLGAQGSGGVVFDFIDFLILQPLNSGDVVDLDDFANLGSGQVWEIAVRDLSQYENFDQTDYETKRDEYLAVLAAQTPTWVREAQWVDLTNPNKVVGMTIYADQQSYIALQQNQNFLDEGNATGFLQSYPINVYGGIHTVLK